MRKVKKILFRLIIYSLLFFVAVIIFVFTYFLFNKDELAENLLLGMNENINGEVSFTDIYLDPFAQFPYVSLALENFNLYEKEEEDRTILEDPVAEFEQVFIVLDIFDLIGDRIVITKVLFSDGYLDLIKHQNNWYNFEIALDKKKTKPVKKAVVENKEKKTGPVKTTKKTKKKKSFISKTLMLDLNRVSFKNVQLEHNNQKDGSQYNMLIYSLISSLSIMPDTINVGLYTKAEIKDLPALKNTMFENFVIESNSKLSYCRNDSVLLIEAGKLILSRAQFRLSGALALKEKGFVDLKIRGADKKLGFLNRLLSKSGLENLKTGSFFFKGNLKGSFGDEIPSLNLDFGIKDLSMRIPGENDSIKYLNLYGSFASGKKMDLSEAIFEIDTLKAVLPGGFIDAVCQIKNFTAPYIDYKISLDANIKGFEKLVKQQFIDSLQGIVNLKSEFNGSFGSDFSSLKVKTSHIELAVDSVSFILANTLQTSFLSGSFSGDYDKVELKNINLNSGESDLIINGHINNLSDLIVDKKRKISTRLNIRSNSLQITDFLATDSLTFSGLGLNFRDIDLRLTALAKKQELFDFKRVPKITINIKKLNGSIDSVLKPLKISKGRLFMTDINDGYLAMLDRLSIKAGKGNFEGGIVYQKEDETNVWLNIDANLKQFRLVDVLDSALIDSGLSIVENPLSAQLKSKVLVAKDRFLHFQLNLDKVNYAEKDNTIRLNKVALQSKGFYFKDDQYDKLNGRFNLRIGELKSRHYKFKEIIYSIIAKKKKFTIVPENDSVLGIKAEGILVAAPYETPPSYSLNYSIKQFPVGDVFVNFLEDSVLSGKADLYINLNFKGHNEKSILQTLDGKIKMRASNLTLYGANLDKFIANYKKDQSLNLLDVGLTIYAGPIGLLATKGGRFARVKVTDRKMKSSIGQIISDWKIVGDSLIVDDVALRTKQNRLALKGWYCYSSDSLDFKIGLLDSIGCSVLKQGFSGPSMKPEMDMGLFNLQPKKSSKEQCKAFYKGKLVHPKKK